MDSNKLSQSLFKVIVYFICCRILRQRGKGAEIKAFDKADDIVSAILFIADQQTSVGVMHLRRQYKGISLSHLLYTAFQ